MATSKRDIYTKFLSKIDDRDLCRLLTEEDMIEILGLRMNESLSVYFKIINQNVSINTSAEFFRESFLGDNINVNFTISQWSVGTLTQSTEPYCSVAGAVLVKNIDYTFDLSTLTFTLIATPELNASVKCGYNFTGEFEATFTDEEEWVTAIGMVLAWSSDNVYVVNKMKNRLTSKDFSSFSPANLLDKLLQLRDRATYEIRDAKNSYSYNGFSGFNS